jgi:hypothetical protein
MPNEEPKNNLNTQTSGVSELDEETEQEGTHKGNWREVFRTAFERARRQHKPAAGRQELGRDKSKAFLLLVGTGIALLLLFFGVFSSPKKRTPLPGETRWGLDKVTEHVSSGDGVAHLSPYVRSSRARLRTAFSGAIITTLHGPNATIAASGLKRAVLREVGPKSGHQ